MVINMNRPFTADSLWTYENGVLKNKLNIKDSMELDLKEKEIVNKKLPNIKLNSFKMEDFLHLHNLLFNELYDFAGKLRDENIVMDGIMLCKADVVELCLTDLFKTLKDIQISSIDDLCGFLAYYYSEFSVIAPFRDGNELVIRKFLEEFVKKFGYDFSFEKINNKELKEAVIYSFYHDTSKLISVFKNYMK